MLHIPHDFTHSKRFHFMIYLWSTMVIFSGIIITYVESYAANPKIKTVFDGIYWAITTVTTVGYGDMVPVTMVGRILAIFVILFGTTVLYSFIFMFISLSITHSQDIYLNRRLQTRLDAIEAKLEDIKKKQHYLILKKSQKK